MGRWWLCTPAVVKTAHKALKDGQSRLIRISPNREGLVEQGDSGQGIEHFVMKCHSRGTLDVFIDPVIPRPLLLIIGISPVAQALCGLAKRTGFSVSVAFPEAEQSMFPEADFVISSFNLPPLDSTRATFIVASTQGKRDEAGLAAALNTGAKYITFIASERKASKLFQSLNERGHDPASVEAIISPAGIDIGAVTPEEIALSVLAALIKARHEGSGQFYADNKVVTIENDGSCCGSSENGSNDSCSSENGSASEFSKAVDPICGMTVNTDTVKYIYDHNDTIYYFCCDGCRQKFAQAPTTYLKEK